MEKRERETWEGKLGSAGKQQPAGGEVGGSPCCPASCFSQPITSTPSPPPRSFFLGHPTPPIERTQHSLPALPSFSGESREPAGSNPKPALRASLHWTLHRWMKEPELHPQQRRVQKRNRGWITPRTEEYMWYGPVMRPCRAKRHTV